MYPQIQRFLGLTYEERPEIYRDASPQHFLQAGLAPSLPAFFMDHGVQDRRLPYFQAVRFHRALNEAKATVEFEAIDHYHHGRTLVIYLIPHTRRRISECTTSSISI